MGEKLLTLKEAAKALDIALQTLYNWRSKGLIPKCKKYKRDFILKFKDNWTSGELRR